MPFTQQLLLKFSSFILGLMITAGSIIVSVTGLLAVRRLVPHHRMKTHNDVTGPIFGTIGAVYAVLLAFVVVVVWENFDKSNLNVRKEASCLVDLYRDAEPFSPTFKVEVRNALKKYAEVVVNEEWGMIARGESSPRVEMIVERMWRLYGAYLPKTTTEQVFLEESVRKLNELGELRTMRLMDSRTGVHPLLWIVLITVGIVTIVFTFFFGAESLKAQMAFSVSLAIIISLILVLILVLDFPFTGDISISPNAFREMAIN